MSFMNDVKTKLARTLYGNYNREVGKVTELAVRDLMNTYTKEKQNDKNQEQGDFENSL